MAILRPSSAHRWVECPGSVQAELAYPETEQSAAAMEGDAAHWLAAEVLTKPEAVLEDYLNKPAPNGVIVDDQMIDGVQMYIDDIIKICGDEFPLSALKVEQTIATIPRIHDENGGTPDCSLNATQSHSAVVVWDLKYGRRVVENRNNWQLINYAIGVLDEITGDNGIADQHIDVEMRIVQPRAYHPDGTCRSWTVKGSELRSYANRLAHSGALALSAEPPTKAGTHCRDCNASHACMTLQQATAEITDRMQGLRLDEMTPAARAVEITYLREASTLVEERLTAIELVSMEGFNNGIITPGYGIGYTPGKLEWNVPDNEVIDMGDLLNVDLRKQEAAITPAQAKKLKIDETVINQYSQKRNGKAKLVTDDKTVAGRVFSN